MTDAIQPDLAWEAFLRRDRGWDGRLVVAVATTGIYCRPSCPARRPARAHVSFFGDGEAAQTAGFRACLRCRPDEVQRDTAAVTVAAALIEAADQPPSLAALAAEAGYAPHHFHRLFKRATGLTPAAYARAMRARRAAAALSDETSVTDAIYAAGSAAPSRFYADAAGRLGMAPSAWMRGGDGVTIRWTVAATSLGPLLIAATAKGLCRVSFDEDVTSLHARFPRADIREDMGDMATLAGRVVAHVEQSSENGVPRAEVPLDLRGTAFQETVWAALRAIPPGETRSYAELAAAAGNPGAVRAAGSACGANPVALVVPCHRARRSDGSLGGYAWGLERKRALLDRERRQPPPDADRQS